MAPPLAEAHIAAEARLRRLTRRAIARIWRTLPGHDRSDLAEWLGRAVPVVLTAQRASVALTEAYLARSLERPPLGLDPERLIGSAARRGSPLEEVYRRPFVTLWSGLAEGRPFEEASAAALARAEGSAAMDVQMAARETFDAIELSDDGIYGYERVADGGACDFCQEVDGAYVKASDGFAFALHNNCGCTLEPLDEPHSGAVTLPDGTPVRDYQYGPLNDRVAVQDHGELGAVLADPTHEFSGQEVL